MAKSRGRRSSGRRLAAAARACKGKKRGAFRACLRKKLRKGSTRRRRRRR